MKNIVYCLFIIIFSLSSLACSNVATLLLERELKVDLEYAENLVSQGRHEAALLEFERIDKRHPDSPFSEKIIFNIGLLYLHPDNKKGEGHKGINTLDRLIKKHPKSKYANLARTLIYYSKENIELKTELEKLKGEFERLKAIQIEFEKREKEIKRQ
jgi:outer membrane protein assembly factor BamD (BamD/ComL family)